MIGLKNEIAIAMFDRCVTRSNDGKAINCKLGLWCVASGSKERTESEALHYWMQYFKDGEYNHLLPQPIQ
jgi:hypothetical protein